MKKARPDLRNGSDIRIEAPARPHPPQRPRVTWKVALACLLVVSGCVAPLQHNVPGADAWNSLPRPAFFLWSHAFSKISVEIDYVPGREPSPFAWEAFTRTVDEVLMKSGTTFRHPTSIELDQPAHADHVWDLDALAAIAQKESSAGLGLDDFTHDGTVHLHVLYLHGGYKTPDGTAALGLQLEGRIIIFPDSFRTAPRESQRTGSPIDDRIERSTLIHEFGHVVGLVNCGIPMIRPHEDPAERCHSSNPKSVMASGIHILPDPTSAPQDALEDRAFSPFEFDEDDLADLEAFREEGRTFQAARIED